MNKDVHEPVSLLSLFVALTVKVFASPTTVTVSSPS